MRGVAKRRPRRTKLVVHQTSWVTKRAARLIEVGFRSVTHLVEQVDELCRGALFPAPDAGDEDSLAPDRPLGRVHLPLGTATVIPPVRRSVWLASTSSLAPTTPSGRFRHQRLGWVGGGGLGRRAGVKAARLRAGRKSSKLLGWGLCRLVVLLSCQQAVNVINFVRLGQARRACRWWPIFCFIGSGSPSVRARARWPSAQQTPASIVPD